MNWKHIVVEGHCIYDLNENKNKKIPECCKYNPGKIGAHCFKYNIEQRQFCPYLGIGTAKSSMVLTNSEGISVNGTCFFDDINIDEKEWHKREKKWIEKQIDYIDSL